MKKLQDIIGNLYESAWDSDNGLDPKSGDERKFKDKHTITKFNNIYSGSDYDDLFQGSTKFIDRPSERHGYNPKQDAKLYASYEPEGDLVEAAWDRDLEDHEPRTVHGVKGVNSKRFKKKFKNQAAQDKFFDHPDREGDYEITHVMKEGTIGDRARQRLRDPEDHLHDRRTKRLFNKALAGMRKKMGVGSHKQWRNYYDPKKDTWSLIRKLENSSYQPDDADLIPESRLSAYSQQIAKDSGLKDGEYTGQFNKIEELSKKTLANYAKKAHQNRNYHDSMSDYGARSRRELNRHRKIASNRKEGITRALDRLTREEADLEEGVSSLDPAGAHAILTNCDAHDDFFKLNSDSVNKLLGAAKRLKYRKHKDAPGSTARMFHQHLQRKAAKHKG